MNSLFSYDSKLMQILMRIGDLMILNVCYILCCLPIVTMGAAQAGLYSAAKVMQDPEDDSSPAKAYFKGFVSGIGSITAAWVIVEILFALLVYCCIWALYYRCPEWILLVALGVFSFMTCLIPLIHSRFACKSLQLIRNAFLLAMAHPLRTLGVLAVNWLPAILFLTELNIVFIQVAPIWLTLYFSTAHLFAYQFMRKPMQGLVDNYIKQQNPEAANEEKTVEKEAATVK